METIRATESLSAKQKGQLHEVADLLLELFRTLARMRYLKPEWIQPGPHDVSALIPLYESLSIDPSIIYLYSILPYVAQHDVDFFQGSDFIDFRDKRDVEEGRDPNPSDYCGGDPAAALMRPWMTPLSRLRNHMDGLIVYDAKRHILGVFPDDGYANTERNRFEGRVYSTWNENGEALYYKYKRGGLEEECGEEEWDKYLEELAAEDDDGDGDADETDSGYGEEEEEEEEEEEDDEDEQENYWDEMDARPAGNVLRDIIRWYHELVETPGGGENCGEEWYVSPESRPCPFPEQGRAR